MKVTMQTRYVTRKELDSWVRRVRNMCQYLGVGSWRERKHGDKRELIMVEVGTGGHTLLKATKVVGRADKWQMKSVL